MDSTTTRRAMQTIPLPAAGLARQATETNAHDRSTPAWRHAGNQREMLSLPQLQQLLHFINSRRRVAAARGTVGAGEKWRRRLLSRVLSAVPTCHPAAMRALTQCATASVCSTTRCNSHNFLQVPLCVILT